LRSSTAPRGGSRKAVVTPEPLMPTLSLDRNFLHAAAIEFAHPRTGKSLSFHTDLPEELTSFLNAVASGLTATQ